MNNSYVGVWDQQRICICSKVSNGNLPDVKRLGRLQRSQRTHIIANKLPPDILQVAAKTQWYDFVNVIEDQVFVWSTNIL